MIGHKNARAGVDVEVRAQGAKLSSSIRPRLINVRGVMAYSLLQEVLLQILKQDDLQLPSHRNCLVLSGVEFLSRIAYSLYN